MTTFSKAVILSGVAALTVAILGAVLLVTQPAQSKDSRVGSDTRDGISTTPGFRANVTLPATALRRPTDRQPGGRGPLGSFVAVFAAVVGLASLLSAAASAQGGQAEVILIYYGNETTPAAAQ